MLLTQSIVKCYSLTNLQWILFFCLIFSTVSVETYAIGNKRIGRIDYVTSHKLSNTSHQQLESSNKNNKEIDKGSSNIRKVASRPKNTNNENKMFLELSELRTMHKQLNQRKKVNDPMNLKNQRLLQQIEKQIQLREVQHGLNKDPNQKHSIQGTSEIPSRPMQRMFYPKQTLKVKPPNMSQMERSLQNFISESAVRRPMTRNAIQTQHYTYNSHLNPNVKKENNIISHYQRPQSIIQDQSSLTSNVIKETATPRHILIPLSAFTSGQAFNGKIILPRRHFYSTSKGNKILVPKEQQIKIAPIPQLSTPVQSTSTSTTTRASPPSTTPSTVSPMTSYITSPSSLSIHETTTPWDFDTMKQKFMERAVKKQDLEIKKLKLEIRVLQREEKHENVSQMENDDAQQPRRGKFGQRQHMFPYFR
ncbi:uncharacterized protein LOC132747323 [Ruditapes philippinarum]|uniref:uncharacterized protein LOC132747323 n=1 Tax=Ruditapes philippinarum TaxID=129788 RepID=UPI00295BE36D|nr:uncharacterized protein LOC132747323 [Ruditapes philippinarum]